MKKYLLLIIVMIFSGCAEKAVDSGQNSEPIPSGLITKNNLIYLGAFRLPEGISETKTWEWGGTAMTYYSEGDNSGENDGYPGSLFGAGHGWEHQVSEISIPVPVISPGKNIEELNTSHYIQVFRDVLNVKNFEIPRTGIQYLPVKGSQSEGKIYYCTGQHMQEGERGVSHGMMNLDLSVPEKKGLWKVGNLLNYVTNDYMFEIPSVWAESFAEGKCLATGRFRDGGQGAMGPSLIAVAPWESGSAPLPGTVIEVKPLLLYENVYIDNPRTMNDYHHSDEWSGGIWVTAGEKAAVIFIGTKGIGDCWYGFSNGVVWEEPYPDVPDFPHDDRGWWSSGFKASFLFYAPDDLRAVAEGEMESWEPQPYESADMGEFLFNGDLKTYTTNNGDLQVQRKYRLGGCSFDRENSIIYVFELFADGDKPLVHAWKVE